MREPGAPVRRCLTLAAAFLVAATSLLAPFAPAGAVQKLAEVDASRYAGADRYATSLLIAEAVAVHAGGTLDSVVMSSGRDWASAVVAAPLAGKLGAPVLVTPPDELRPDAAAFLRRVGVSRAVLIGANSDADGVGPTVVEGLRELGLSVSRIAQSDRYETAAAVARAVGEPGQMGALGTTAVVANGDVFADALVAGAFAARGRHPVLLSSRQELHKSAASYLSEFDVDHVVMMGGTAALSAEVESAVRALGINVTRLAGATRYETAVAAARHVAGKYGTGCFSDRRLGLARADVPFDSFSAAPLLARVCAPLLLSGLITMPAPTVEHLNRARAVAAAANRRSVDVRVLGGYAAIARTAISAYERRFPSTSGPHVQHLPPCVPDLGSDPVPVIEDSDSVDASFSPDCSRIVYQIGWRNIPHPAVWTARPDGTDRVRLTDGFLPVWSPDGTRIAIHRRSEGPDDGDSFTRLFIINADGSGEKLLAEEGFSPAWSPDGTRIAFIKNSGRGSDGAATRPIFVINADGSGEKQLTAGDIADRSLAWSPDGTRISFVRLELESQTEYIAVTDADGQKVTPLTRGRPKGSSTEWTPPAWSPDGSKIAYLADASLIVMNADGSEPRAVPFEFVPREFAWSPDGSALAFTTTRFVDDDTYAGGTRVDDTITIASPDGSRTAEVVRHSSPGPGSGYAGFGTLTAIYAPKWAPDGRSILYERNTKTGSAPKTYLAPVPELRPAPVAEDCRPIDSPSLGIGFAPSRAAAPSLGTLRIGVLFMDFADAQAVHSTETELARGDLAYTQDVIDAVSYGNLSVEFVPYHTWLRAPETTDHYSRPGGPFEIAETAAAMARDELDFDDIDAFLTVLPGNHFGAATLAGHAAVGGGDDRRNAAIINSSRAYFDPDGWKDFLPPITMQLIGAPYLGDLRSVAHTGRPSEIPELLPGQRWHRIVVGIRNLNAWFASEYEAYYGEHYEPLSWLRWQFGWLKPENVMCVNRPESIVRLAPLAGTGEGTIMAAIPASHDAIIVLESRRRIGHDALSAAHRDAIASGEADGSLIGDRVLVYVVDPTASRVPIRLLGDDGFNTLERYPFLAVGDSATVAGYTVTVTADDGDTHTVTIIKSG